MHHSEKKNTFNKTLLIFFLLSFIYAIGFNLYKFYLAKNYNFIVEAACNPESETCFYRDCTDASVDCPPNSLSFYKKFIIKAGDFDACTDNSCARECREKMIRCLPLYCDESAGDVCRANASQ